MTPPLTETPPPRPGARLTVSVTLLTTTSLALVMSPRPPASESQSFLQINQLPELMGAISGGNPRKVIRS